jgi:hypothetical protein
LPTVAARLAAKPRVEADAAERAMDEEC